VAMDVLKLLSDRLGQSKPELVIHHMHLVLAELFVQQASDDTGDLNDAIPGGLDFIAACGVNSDSLSDMIQVRTVIRDIEI